MMWNILGVVLFLLIAVPIGAIFGTVLVVLFTLIGLCCLGLLILDLFDNRG